MDTYHKVLIKLLEATEGRETKPVDFRELVKQTGFLGNYPNIFDQLSQEGWIAEDRKADYVRITHWGISEAKKTLKNESEGATPAASVENAQKCLAASKEFTGLLEAFAKKPTKAALKDLEKKFSDLEASFAAAKKDAV